MFFDREGKSQQHLDILLNAFLGQLVEFVIFEGVVHDPGGVEAEVDANVAVLLVSGIVEVRAEAENADGGGLELPKGIESGGWIVGICGFREPELPLHLELVSHIVVELLGGLGYGVFDDGGFGVLGAVVVDVDALIGRGFGEVDGIDRGSGDAFFSTNEHKLAEDRNQCGGQRLEAEVGEPEA